jgi:hypothetical protein
VGQLTGLGQTLLEQSKFAAAEPVLRECLAIREKTEANVWTTFHARSMLGASLLGQKKFTEAEPLLLTGYEGLKRHERNIPGFKPRLTEALERVVHLYDAIGSQDKAARWRKKLKAARLAH